MIFFLFNLALHVILYLWRCCDLPMKKRTSLSGSRRLLSNLHLNHGSFSIVDRRTGDKKIESAAFKCAARHSPRTQVSEARLFLFITRRRDFVISSAEQQHTAAVWRGAARTHILYTEANIDAGWVNLPALAILARPGPILGSILRHSNDTTNGSNFSVTIAFTHREISHNAMFEMFSAEQVVIPASPWNRIWSPFRESGKRFRCVNYYHMAKKSGFTMLETACGSIISR